MKKRKNPAPARERRTVVERGHFATGNSGINITMIEEVENYDWDEQDRDWYQHHLEIRHSAFGAGSSFRTPIAGPAMCQYYIEAFTRLRDRMVSDPKYRIPHPFERYGYGDVPTTMDKKKWNRSSDTHRIADIVNGMKREAVWSPEIVVSENASETRLLGYNIINDEGEIVSFETLDSEPIYGAYASSTGESSGIFKKSDIGKLRSEVVENRPSLQVEPVDEEKS